jgi:hypothetical protein
MRLFLVFVVLLVFSTTSAQVIDNDSSGTNFLKDTSQRVPTETEARSYDDIMKDILNSNRNINYAGSAVTAINMTRQSNGKEWLFYILATDILLLGIFKVFYSKYFNNIFRVFFNTSLRQNQLTDILLQARLPSLIFNLFFIVNAGIYLWLVINTYSVHVSVTPVVFLLICIAALGIIYVGKFFALKIMGWVTGMAEPADTYIFVIFLINKIIGIILIPFIVLLAFAPTPWEKGLTFLSLAIILLLILLRFYRSYGLLEHQFTLNRFHFFIYVLALEVLPVLILYKIAIKMTLIT